MVEIMRMAVHLKKDLGMIGLNRNKGFGLIDISISIFMLTLGLFGLLKYQTHIEHVLTHHDHLQHAVLLTDNTLETIKKESIQNGDNFLDFIETLNKEKLPDYQNVQFIREIDVEHIMLDATELPNPMYRIHAKISWFTNRYETQTVFTLSDPA